MSKRSQSGGTRHRVVPQPLRRAAAASIEPVERRVLMAATPAPGSLDGTFGTGGVVLNQQATVGAADAVAVSTATGNVLVAGTDDSGVSFHSGPVEVQRYSAAGVLDTSFGTNGTAINPNVVAQPLQVAVAADGGILVFTSGDQVVRFTAAGTVDTTFGSGGAARFAGGSSFTTDLNGAFAVLADGDLVAAGTVSQTSGPRTALTALTAAGKVDTAFGSGGLAVGGAGGFDAVTVDAAGRLVAVGGTGVGAGGEVPTGTASAGLVERFTAAGQPDPTFGTGGSVTAADATFFDAAVVLPSGNLEAAGVLQQGDGVGPSNNLLKLNTFTASGAAAGYSSPVSPVTLAPQLTTRFLSPEGQLVLSGTVYASELDALRTVRFDADGSVDTAFGTGGVVDDGPGPGDASPTAGGLAFGAGGAVVFDRSNVNGVDFDPTRLTATGTPDATFGVGGTAAGRPLFQTADAVLALASGQTLVAGQVTVGGTLGEYVRRYNADGTIDAGFAPGDGYGGTTGYAFVAGPGTAGTGSTAALAQDASGRILLGDSDGVVRLTAAGAIDTTFGTAGRAAVAGLSAFAVSSDGTILATSDGPEGGSALSQPHVTRLTAAGAVDTTFGTNGTADLSVTLPFGLLSNDVDEINEVLPVAVQADGKVLVGGSVSQDDPTFDNGEGLALAVERLNANGTVDTTFGTAGVATANYNRFDPDPGIADDAAAAKLAVLADGDVLVGGTDLLDGIGDEDGATAAEFLPTGQPNLAFGSAGQVAPDTGSGISGSDNQVFDTGLTVQADGGLTLSGVLTVDTDTGQSTEFYLHRYTADGLSDPTFGTAGLVTTQIDPNGGDANGPTDAILAAALTADGKLVVAGTADPASGTSAADGFALARYTLGATGTAAAVSGTVFDDANGNGRNDDGDPSGLQFQVYDDVGNVGHYVSGDPSTVANVYGDYLLTGLPTGPQIIRVALPSGFRETFPAQSAGQHVAASTSAVASGADFGFTNTIYVGGTVTSATGAGVAGVTVYADQAGSGRLASTDSTATTTAAGAFAFTGLAAGTYTFRIVVPAGDTQTAPAGNAGETVTVASGGVQQGLSFKVATTPTPTPTGTKLTGTLIGTTGSYGNGGNTIAKAVDGNLNTYFDSAAADGSWVGYDLGTAATVTGVSFAPRAGYESRMVGGVFQGSNSPQFTGGVTTLYTVRTAPKAGTLTTASVTTSAAFRYVRYLSPNGGYGDVAEVNFFGSAGPGHAPAAQLTGTALGTAGSYRNDGDTIAKALDGNLNTFFDGPTANGNSVGLDLGTQQSLDQIRFAPRSGLRQPHGRRRVPGVAPRPTSAPASPPSTRSRPPRPAAR